MKLTILKSTDEVLTSLADYFVRSAAGSVSEQGQFSVALSGGSSPKKLYELLASAAYRNQVEWDKVFFFFGDERYVPDTDPASNYLMVKKALFEPLAIPGHHVYPVNTSLAPPEAAAQYMEDINGYFKGSPACFDLVLLGLGDNSHTASLFPATPVLHEKAATVKEVFIQEQQVYRITLTAPLINQARRIAFLVYGNAKAEAVHHVLEDARDIENYPAQLIQPSNGELKWFLDKSAASGISLS